MRKLPTYSDLLISWDKQVVILIISIINRITDRMLHWATPISYGFELESILFICVWKVQFSRKCFMKMGSLPYRPWFVRYLSMPYGYDISQAFSRSKRTLTICSFLIDVSLIKVSIWTIWSMVLLFLKPVCRFERRLFDSRNHVSLRFINLLRILQIQLVKAIGLWLVGFVGSLCFLKIGMVVAYFHKVGMLPEIQILLYISRRYFKDIVGSSLRRK